ncbi:hypothetical protein [Streptomyces sp. NPDC006739]|uniref:hypothetical protein n=1 Tax=Streptomyces sp. NPDC006739 TaxID=3364763 RepID=UPI0036850998
MGAFVAACAATNAASVLWCEAGLSPATVARAQHFGLTGVATPAELLDRSDIVISLCPPAAAEDLARDVAGHGFSGVYVEANHHPSGKRGSPTFSGVLRPSSTAAWRLARAVV